MDKIFCNVHMLRVPCSWTGSIQMKSNMTFIRGTRCIKKKKDNFKNGGEVKRLKGCTLALSMANENVLKLKIYEMLTFLALYLAVYCNFDNLFKMSLEVPKIYIYIYSPKKVTHNFD